MVLSVAFVPLTPAEQYSADSALTMATQAAGSDPPPSPETKLPTEPQGDMPNPFSPDEATGNTVSGSLMEITSGLTGFAGLWVDDHGLVHLAVQQGYAGEIKGILGDRFKGQVAVVEVQHSYRDLVARRDSISAHFDSLTQQGLRLMEWGPDEVHNTVWISLVDYTEVQADLARTLLGQDIVVKPSMTEGGRNDLFSNSVQAK